MESVILEKRRHNQLALVSRLPIEVFGEIFGYLHSRTSQEWDQIDDPGYHPSLLWIPEATHVCHAWREVALHTAFLWQEIDVTASPSWALEFASRSRNAPLCITASNPKTNRAGPVCSYTEQIVQASVERVQKIALVRIPVPSVRHILSLRSSSVNERITFPVLQHLEVSTFDLFLILTDDSLCAPSLTSLEVRGFCSVDWKAFSLLQNLSHLTLNTLWDEPVADLDAIHKALCQMPSLEELTICPAANTIGPEAIIPPAPDQTVALPKLRSINLRSYFPLWLSLILHCIACGRQRDLSISAVLRNDADIKQFHSNIPSIFQQHVEGTSIRSLRIRFSAGCIILSGWRLVNKPWVGVGPAPINITIEMARISCPVLYLLNELFLGLNFRRLTSLSLFSTVPIPTETWVRLFGSLPNLLMVDIQSGLYELCAALVDGIPDNSQLASTTDRIIPFRALESIAVWKEKVPLDIDYIRTCLRKRLELKVPLKELHIRFNKDVKGHVLDVGMLEEFVECFVVSLSSK